MASPIVVLIVGLILLIMPFLAAYLLYQLVRERKSHSLSRLKLNEKTTLLEEKTKTSEKALQIGQTLLNEKKSCEARLSEIEKRFKPILDLDAETERLGQSIIEKRNEIVTLQSSYATKKVVYDRLIKEVAIFDEKLAFAEMGVYEPHFDFTDSEEYKSAIVNVREEQKGMVGHKTAVICTTEWMVEGSAAKGKTMTNRNIRLTLRAFNNECEAAIANIRWNNANAMEKRISSARIQIDKLNESNRTFISEQYLRLKLQELYLTHEYREKIKVERDERAEANRLVKDEQKLIRDMEKAQSEEDRYQRLLPKARAEAGDIVGPQLDAFNEQIKTLERDLAEAQARVERAQAMAERTRSGYVYIISNIGSFGEDIIKIGLTRRLDPMDRVRELGDASVPFIFDTHAIIYSDDAPSLERALHGEFEPTRVNTQNYRKEFFRASLEDVEAAVQRLAPDAPFFKDVEAQDYRETLARRHQVLSNMGESVMAAMPASI